MKLGLVQLRYRAASKMSLCAGHHEIHRSDDGNEVWVECDDKELNRLTVEGWAKETGLDVSHQVQLIIREVMFEHEQDVVGKVVIELLNRVEAVGGFDSAYNRCEHAALPSVGPWHSKALMNRGDGGPSAEAGNTAGEDDGVGQGHHLSVPADPTPISELSILEFTQPFDDIIYIGYEDIHGFHPASS